MGIEHHTKLGETSGHKDQNELFFEKPLSVEAPPGKVSEVLIVAFGFLPSIRVTFDNGSIFMDIDTQVTDRIHHLLDFVPHNAKLNFDTNNGAGVDIDSFIVLE